MNLPKPYLLLNEVRNFRVAFVFLNLNYALAKEAAFFLNASQSELIDVPIHAWWSSTTLACVGSAPIDWRRYTEGLVEKYTVIGAHSDVIQSIQVHQKLDEILDELNHHA